MRSKSKRETTVWREIEQRVEESHESEPMQLQLEDVQVQNDLQDLECETDSEESGIDVSEPDDNVSEESKAAFVAILENARSMRHEDVDFRYSRLPEFNETQQRRQRAEESA